MSGIVYSLSSAGSAPPPPPPPPCFSLPYRHMKKPDTLPATKTERPKITHMTLFGTPGTECVSSTRTMKLQALYFTAWAWPVAVTAWSSFTITWQRTVLQTHCPLPGVGEVYEQTFAPRLSPRIGLEARS